MTWIRIQKRGSTTQVLNSRSTCFDSKIHENHSGFTHFSEVQFHSIFSNNAKNRQNKNFVNVQNAIKTLLSPKHSMSFTVENYTSTMYFQL